MLAHLWLSTILLAMMALVQASPVDLTFALLERLRQFQAITPREATTNIPLSSFPSQCQTGCSPAVTALNSCTSALCLCAQTIDASLAGCIQCSLKADDSPSWVATAQQAADFYNGLCKGTQASSIAVSIPGTATGNSSVSTFSFGLPTTTLVTTSSTATPTPTTITAVPSSLSTSAAKQGAHSNAEFGLIGIMITFLMTLLT